MLCIACHLKRGKSSDNLTFSEVEIKQWVFYLKCCCDSIGFSHVLSFEVNIHFEDQIEEQFEAKKTIIMAFK